MFLGWQAGAGNLWGHGQPFGLFKSREVFAYV